MEQNNLPTECGPCLLAKGILELREEVKWYLTFTDEEVFWGVPVLEAYVEKGLTTPSPANIPKTSPVPEPQPKEQAAKFVGWDKVLHPSQPVIAARETPQPTQILRLRGRSHPYSQIKPVKSPVHLPEVTSPSEPSPSTTVVTLVKSSTPPHDFEGVTVV